MKTPLIYSGLQNAGHADQILRSRKAEGAVLRCLKGVTHLDFVDVSTVSYPADRLTPNFAVTDAPFLKESMSE